MKFLFHEKNNSLLLCFLQGDLNMGVCFSRISLLLAAVVWLLSYGYFYGAQLIRFHIKFSTLVGNCLKGKLHILIKESYVKTNQV